MTFGKAHKIQLFANTEGLAISSHRFWIGRVLTTLAGYIFSSFMSASFYFLIYKGRYNLVIYILLTMLAISMFFWIGIGMVSSGFCTFSGGFVWMLWKVEGTIIENVVLFLVSILFVQSITSAFEIMYCKL